MRDVSNICTFDFWFVSVFFPFSKYKTWITTPKRKLRQSQSMSDSNEEKKNTIFFSIALTIILIGFENIKIYTIWELMISGWRFFIFCYFGCTLFINEMKKHGHTQKKMFIYTF